MKGLKEVFSRKKYLLIMIITAFAFYFLNAFIPNAKQIINFYSVYDFLFATNLSVNILIFGFPNNIKTHSFISLIIISILFGILIGMLIYKTSITKKESAKRLGFFTSTGVFLGVLAPGCAACGVGIASILGLGAFLSFLPYEGLELSVLSIALLLIANYKLSKALLNANSCQIKLPTSERR